jgi:prolipoprotein diacylglyceryl transferase
MRSVTFSLAGVVGSIPSPPWNGIALGPLQLRAYGLLIAIGAMVAIRMLGSRLEATHSGTKEDAASIGIWGVAAGVVGARLYHVATEWDRFADNLRDIPQIWHGGLGIPGGVLVGASVGVWVGRRRGVQIGDSLHAAAPAIPVAQAIGRWGNWFNQELFGRETGLAWGLRIDDSHLPPGYSSGTTFHPTFLYESIWNLALAYLLVRLSSRRSLGGSRLFALYVIGYGCGRFWIEGLRIDAASVVGTLRWNQWVALIAVVLGFCYLAISRNRTISNTRDVESDSGSLASEETDR